LEQSKIRLVNRATARNIQKLTNSRMEKALNNFFLYPNQYLSEKKIFTVLEYKNFACTFFYKHFLEKANHDYFNGLDMKKWPESILNLTLNQQVTTEVTYDIVTYKEPIFPRNKNQDENNLINSIYRISFGETGITPDTNILDLLQKQWEQNPTTIRLILIPNYRDNSIETTTLTSSLNNLFN